MAYVVESENWETGVYQIEVSDPVGGGPNGIDNLPHKQLASRTKYLKSITDDVIASRGTYPTLKDRMDTLEPLEASTTNAIIALAMQAAGQAGLANKELAKLQNIRKQTGLVTIKNRGVISGCTVSKSEVASRNLAITAGSIFMAGRIFPVTAESAGASVPSNPGQSAAVCYAYLYVTPTSTISFACTNLNEAAPDTALVLYQLTVPAGNNDLNDPYLANVTLTDIRRLEPNFPTWFASASYAAVALPYAFLDSNYLISLDVVSTQGAGLLQGGDLYISTRNVNGFNIVYNGIADQIVVRWSIYNPKV
jgi:hypothetical protein